MMSESFTDPPSAFAPELPAPRRVRVKSADAPATKRTLARIWPNWLPGPPPDDAVLVEVRDRKWTWTVFIRLGVLAAGLALVGQMYDHAAWQSSQRIVFYCAGVVLVLAGIVNVGEWIDSLLERQWLVFTGGEVVACTRTFDAHAPIKYHYWAHAAARRAVLGVEVGSCWAGESLFGGEGETIRHYTHWRLRLRLDGTANPFDVDVDASAEDMRQRTESLSASRLVELQRMLDDDAKQPAPGVGDIPAELELGEVGAPAAHWLARQVANWSGAPLSTEMRDS